MHIRRLRFKNLNSLVGEWNIDFTDTRVASEGIIAITGPTGAGKSTILDAISLALYGRTPRLDSINQTGNEIMSRRTGECFAEVTFETATGSYRSHWSQRRAKNKPDGRLQPQKHELADAATDAILASKINDVAALVPEITGMDFSRFTRTMFLAQGNFAAFLLAKPDERAPILEQVTGTGIYSDISKRVHERHSQERKLLDELHACVGGVLLLSQEEEQLLLQELEEKKASVKVLQERLERKKAEADVLRRIDRLEKEQYQLSLERQSWQLRMESFVPSREMLEKAEKTLELAGAYSELMALRAEQQSEANAHAECLAELPQCKAAVEQAVSEKRTGEETLAAAEKQQQEALPVFRKARELDAQLQAQQAAIRNAEADVAQVSKSIQELVKTREENGVALTRLQQKMETLSAQLNETAADASLVEQLEGICSQFSILQKTVASLQVKQRERDAASRQQENLASLVGRKATELKTVHQQAGALHIQMKEQEMRIVALLEGISLSEWRTRLLQESEKSALLAQVVEAEGSLKNAQLEGERAENRKQDCDREISKVNLLLPEREALYAQLLETRDALEKQQILEQKIGSYEQERALLAVDSPCPLCGSLEHPYVQQRESLPAGDSEEKLAELRRTIERTETETTSLKVSRATLQKEAEMLAAVALNSLRSREKFQGVLETLCAKLAISVPDADMHNAFAKESESVKSALDAISYRIAEAEKLEASLASLRTSVSAAQDALRKSESNLLQTEYEEKNSTKEVLRLDADLQILFSEQSLLLEGLARRLRPYGIEQVQPEFLKSVVAALTIRRDVWQERSREKLQLEQTATALNSTIIQQNEQILRAEEDLSRRTDVCSVLCSEYDSLLTARQILLNGKNVDDDEYIVTQNVDSARKLVKIHSAKLEEAERLLAARSARSADLSRSLMVRGESLLGRERDFGGLLKNKGFTDEAAYSAARLPQEERQKLFRQAQLLTDEGIALDTREKEVGRRLTQAKQNGIPNDSLSSLESEIGALGERQQLMQREIGAIDRRLADNAEAGERKKEILCALEVQKAECVRWDLLHELIGSADGKKYRNFAQGLTFDLLVAHANRQLASLNDRYLLTHCTDAPLEISVIDNYQAGEVRTAKNLSGGESFLVSLALALGLSQMVGKNIQAGSLFLDEGFGSLDEAALETALDALGCLKQSGKLIVIISHVQALKERIGTRIQVSPVSGGKSRISGPGCGIAGTIYEK